jgi:hypothetical protein
MRKFNPFNGLVLGLALFSFAINSMEQETSVTKKNSSLYSKAKSLGYIYTTLWTSALAHELGHALPAHYFYKAPIDVTMGSCNLNNKTLLDMKYVKISGLHPFHGYNKDSILGNSRWKNAVILSGGPAAGILTSSLIFATAIKLQSDHDAVSYNTKLLTCAAIIIQHGANLYPAYGTDGYLIWQHLFENKSLRQQIISKAGITASVCILSALAMFKFTDFYFQGMKKKID